MNSDTVLVTRSDVDRLYSLAFSRNIEKQAQWKETGVGTLGGAGLGLLLSLLTPKDKDESTLGRILRYVLGGATLGGVAGLGVGSLGNIGNWSRNSSDSDNKAKGRTEVAMPDGSTMKVEGKAGDKTLGESFDDFYAGNARRAVMHAGDTGIAPLDYTLFAGGAVPTYYKTRLAQRGADAFATKVMPNYVVERGKWHLPKVVRTSGVPATTKFTTEQIATIAKQVAGNTSVPNKAKPQKLLQALHDAHYVPQGSKLYTVNPKTKVVVPTKDGYRAAAKTLSNAKEHGILRQTASNAIRGKGRYVGRLLPWLAAATDAYATFTTPDNRTELGL